MSRSIERNPCSCSLLSLWLVSEAIPSDFLAVQSCLEAYLFIVFSKPARSTVLEFGCIKNMGCGSSAPEVCTLMPYNSSAKKACTGRNTRFSALELAKVLVAIVEGVPVSRLLCHDQFLLSEQVSIPMA